MRLFRYEEVSSGLERGPNRTYGSGDIITAASHNIWMARQRKDTSPCRNLVRLKSSHQLLSPGNEVTRTWKHFPTKDTPPVLNSGWLFCLLSFAFSGTCTDIY